MQISIIQFCFQAFFFCVLRCVLAVTCSARDELSEATVSRGVGPFFRPAFTCCLWKQPSDRTADLLDWAVTSPSIQQAHTRIHTRTAGWLIVLLLLLALLLRTLKPIAFGGRNEAETHAASHGGSLSLSRFACVCVCVCACLLVLVLVYKFSHIMDTAAIFTTAAFVLCEREQRCDAASADSAAFLFCNHISAAVLALFSVCDGVCACVCVLSVALL